jgi:hypothetical protein
MKPTDRRWADGNVLPFMCSVCYASAKKAVVKGYNIVGFHAGVHLSSTLNTEAVCLSETSARTYQTAVSRNLLHSE